MGYAGESPQEGISRLLREAASLRDLNDGRLSLLQSMLQIVHSRYGADICLAHQLSPAPPSVIARVGPAFPERAEIPQPGLLAEFSAETTNGPGREFVCSAAITATRQMTLQLRTSQDLRGEFLLELAEVLADLFRRELMSVLERESQQNTHIHQITMSLYAAADVDDVVTCLASDAAGFLGCTRICVVRKSSGVWELVSATSVLTPNTRSHEARRICEIVESMELANATGAARRNPSGDRTTASLVVPLTESGDWKETVHAAVFEWPDAAAADSGRNSAFRICRHAVQAISILEQRSLPRWLSGRLFFKTRLLTLLLTSIVVVVLIFVKTEFRVAVDGQIVPENRIRIFAPESGLVTEVTVVDGARVSVGDSLCQLKSDDLDLRSHEIEGRIAATQSRLVAIEANRSSRGAAEGTFVAVEQAELREQLKSLQAQAVLLEKRMKQLNIEASLSGEVLGHHLQELLTGRPVQRGQFLFEIADKESGWIIEMRVPDEALAHLLDVSRRTGKPLRITYSLETYPDQVFISEISKIENVTSLDKSGRLITFAHAKHCDDQRIVPRPGSGVFVKIDCGQRPLGFVLCHRLLAKLQRWWHLGIGF